MANTVFKRTTNLTQQQTLSPEGNALHQAITEACSLINEVQQILKNATQTEARRAKISAFDSIFYNLGKIQTDLANTNNLEQALVNIQNLFAFYNSHSNLRYIVQNREVLFQMSQHVNIFTAFINFIGKIVTGKTTDQSFIKTKSEKFLEKIKATIYSSINVDSSNIQSIRVEASN